MCLWWGASRALLRSHRSALSFYRGLHMLCVFMLLLMRVSLVGRLASLAALASLGALLALWTSYAVCLHVVTDECLWWGTSRASPCSPRSAPCLHCGLHMLCVFMLFMMRVFGGAHREPRCVRLARRPACIVDFICCVSIVLLMSVSFVGAHHEPC